MMNFERLALGVLGVNCYVVDDGDGSVFVIDPGAEAERIVAAVEKLSPERVTVLLTHAHADHIGAVGGVCRRFSAPVFLHPGDVGLYHSPDNHLPPFLPLVEDLPEPSGEFPDIDGLEVIATPGHTPGGVCFHFPGMKVLFSGDTLFAGSVGRTDLPGGDTVTLMNSIKKRLYCLPGDTKVLPGHGGFSDIAREKRGNPFVRG